MDRSTSFLPKPLDQQFPNWWRTKKIILDVVQWWQSLHPSTSCLIFAATHALQPQKLVCKAFRAIKCGSSCLVQVATKIGGNDGRWWSGTVRLHHLCAQYYFLSVPDLVCGLYFGGCLFRTLQVCTVHNSIIGFWRDYGKKLLALHFSVIK